MKIHASLPHPKDSSTLVHVSARCAMCHRSHAPPIFLQQRDTVLFENAFVLATLRARARNALKAR